MKTPVANADILNVMKVHCSSAVVDSVLQDLRNVHGVEGHVLGLRVEGGKSGGSLLEVLSDRAKLDHLITMCQSRLPEEEVSGMLIGLGDVFKLHGDLGKAEEFYSLVLARARSLGQKRYIAEGLLRRGELFSRLGRWKDSSADLSESRLLFAELKESASVGRVENILGTSLAEQGKLKQAQRYFGRALSVFEQAAEQDMTGTVLMNIGIVYSITGQWDKGLVQYKRAQSYFEELGDVNRLAELHHNMGMSFLRKGMHKEAIGEFDSAFALSANCHLVNLMGLACLGKADAHARIGDYPVALKLVSQSIGYFSFTSERLNIADAYKIKGIIHREMKNFTFADTYLKTSLRMNIELNNQLNIAETCVEIGKLAQAQGNKGEALRSFEQAFVFYKKIGAEHAVAGVQASIVALKERTE